MLDKLIPALTRAVFIGAVGLGLGLAYLVLYKGVWVLLAQGFGFEDEDWFALVFLPASLAAVIYLTRRGKLS